MIECKQTCCGHQNSSLEYRWWYYRCSTIWVKFGNILGFKPQCEDCCFTVENLPFFPLNQVSKQPNLITCAVISSVCDKETMTWTSPLCSAGLLSRPLHLRETHKELVYLHPEVTRPKGHLHVTVRFCVKVHFLQIKLSRCCVGQHLLVCFIMNSSPL